MAPHFTMLLSTILQTLLMVVAKSRTLLKARVAKWLSAQITIDDITWMEMMHGY